MRERGAARVVVPQSRDVVCYRCAATLPVSGYAESASCPRCAGNLRLLPIEVTKGHWGTSLLTTESIVVHPDAQVIANLSVASGDITISGSVHSMCVAGGTITITESGELRGGVRAAQVIIEPGARIVGSVIESPSKALGSLDIDAASRARPGTGPAAQIEIKPFENPLDDDNEQAPPTIVFPSSPQHHLRVVR
jgi:hypothetical protein